MAKDKTFTLTRKEVLEGLAEGRKDFKECDIRKANLIKIQNQEMLSPTEATWASWLMAVTSNNQLTDLSHSCRSETRSGIQAAVERQHHEKIPPVGSSRRCCPRC